MPELPEVENIRIQLEKYLVGLPRGGALRGHKIENVEIRDKKYAIRDKKKIIGAKIKNVRRFGKALVIDLDNNCSVVIHIKLTGQLIYRGPNLGKVPNLSTKVLGGLEGKHTHVIFHLDKDAKLYYNDVRKFGWIKIVQSSKLKVESDFIARLGPEPVVDDKNPPENPLTLGKFREIVGSTSRAIKTLLMDQNKIGGVGNIYANDALWLSGIHPEKQAKKLKDEEIKKLHKAILEVLKEGLKRGGASELTFVTPDGKEGSYQEHFLAYGREGKICPRCKKAKFKKTKIGGRGTYFCPTCQR